MMTAGLMMVFALAKIAILWGRALPASPWLPIAYLWQDGVVVVAFGAVEWLVIRHAMRSQAPLWILRIAYVALVVLVAVNVPLERVLSSPLTAPMVRAARGALADSIRAEASLANLGLGALTLTAGILLPLVWRKRFRARPAWLGVSAACALLGPVAMRRVDTGGLDRNVFLALVRSSLPRVHGVSDSTDWRASIAGADSGTDLTTLRGEAAGYNVLLVVLESTGAEYLKPYGAVEDPTPRLTAFAAHSVVFDNTYAVYPESIKGLVAILASRYPGFDVSPERHAALMKPSLPRLLDAAGYRTALFHSGRFMYLGMDTVLSQSGFARLEDAGDIGGNHGSSFGIDEPATVHRVLRWIDEGPRGKPFLVAYLPVAGHHPYSYSGPGVFAGETPVGRYRNALHEGDQAFGELLDGLRARGLEDSTLVVVIADHGEAFGQHPDNFGHNLALYDENVRVPLIVHLPGAANLPVRAHDVASLLDLAPTVLDLLGVPQPREFQGESLLPGRSRLALFFTDYSLGLLGVRDGCIKDIYELESGRSRLFDLCRDPDEQHDLAASRSSEIRAYRTRLTGWSADQVARIR